MKVGPNAVFSPDGWGWFLLSTIAKAYLVFTMTLAAIAIVPALFGLHGSVVQTGSMEPHISPGDVVLTSAVPEGSPVPIGHVVEYRSPAAAEPSGVETIRLHRIVGTTEEGLFITAGDANADVDSTPISREQIIGQGRLLVPFVGLPGLWLGTGNLLAFAGWALTVLLALALLTRPAFPRRRPPSHGPKTDASSAVTATDEGVPAADAQHGATTMRVRDRGRGRFVAGGIVAGLVLAGLTVIPSGAVDAPFTARATNAGNSWQIAAGVDTRGYRNYRAAIAPDNPWAYFRLDEAPYVYTAQDSSANNRDATYTYLGVTNSTTGALSNETNRAVTLAGTAASTFATPGPAIPRPIVFSIELWFKTSSGQGGELVSFGNAQIGQSNRYDRNVYMGTNGRLNFGAYNGTTTTLATSSRSYNDSAWHHVVATMSSSGMALYVDGARVATNPNTVAEDYAGYWRIGGDNLAGWPNQPTNTYFSGSLDEISIYNSSALSASRVNAHFQAAQTSTAGNYVAEVNADKPSIYYHLEETKVGPVIDYAGQRRDATYPSSGITYGVAGVLPKRNNRAATFNGSNGSLVVNAAHSNPQTFSMETWFNTTTRRGGQLIGFANSTGASPSRHDRHLYMTNTGQLIFGVQPGATKTIRSTTSFNDGNWHHVVATLSSTGMSLYVDGALVASDATTKQAGAYSGYWHIASGTLASWPDQPTSSYFNGTLDEVAIYTTALTPAQVANHYRAR